MDTKMSGSHDLVESDDVIGTNVYGSDGKHIGSVEKLVLEKKGGRVSYAVLSFGGFLGMGNDYYPLPWAKLNYDESLGGFRVDVTKDQINGAPKYDRESDYDWSPASGRKVYDYYGISPYW